MANFSFSYQTKSGIEETFQVTVILDDSCSACDEINIKNKLISHIDSTLESTGGRETIIAQKLLKALRAEPCKIYAKCTTAGDGRCGDFAFYADPSHSNLLPSKLNVTMGS